MELMEDKDKHMETESKNRKKLLEEVETLVVSGCSCCLFKSDLIANNKDQFESSQSWSQGKLDCYEDNIDCLVWSSRGKFGTYVQTDWKQTFIVIRLNDPVYSQYLINICYLQAGRSV